MEEKIIQVKSIPKNEIWPWHYSRTGAIDIKPSPQDVGVDNNGNIYYYLLEDKWIPISALLENADENLVEFAIKATQISKNKFNDKEKANQRK